MKLFCMSLSVAALMLGYSGLTLADEPSTFEQHGKHEHGTATLSITASDSGVELFLDSPAINLVGFEHMPANDDDKEHLDDVVKKLENGDELFTLSADAGCELKDTEVLSGLLGDKMDNGQGQSAPESRGTTAPADEHQDMEVTWEYTCSAPNKLKDIQTKLFSAFPNGFQRIHAEWVTGSGSSATELTQDDSIRLE